MGEMVLPEGIEVYTIGESWQQQRLLRFLSRHHLMAHWRKRRRTSDRWGRRWQAEWDGCQHAVRAWTREGAIIRACRAHDRVGRLKRDPVAELLEQQRRRFWSYWGPPLALAGALAVGGLLATVLGVMIR